MSHSIEDPNVNAEQLSNIQVKLEAAVQYVRRIHWTLETARPWPGPLLQMLVTNLSSMEGILGRMIDRYSCLIPFLNEQYNATGHHYQKPCVLVDPLIS